MELLAWCCPAVICFRELQGSWVKAGDLLAQKIGPAQAS